MCDECFDMNKIDSCTIEQQKILDAERTRPKNIVKELCDGNPHPDCVNNLNCSCHAKCSHSKVK